MTGERRPGARKLLLVAAATLACTQLLGCAHLADGTGPPASVKDDARWLLARGVRFRAQRDAHGCGPAALAMVIAASGRPVEGALAKFVGPSDGHGVTAGQLREAARQEGLLAFVFPGTEGDLTSELRRSHPVVLGIANRTGLRRYSHFVVLAGMDTGRRRWLIADPDRGWRVVDHDVLMAEWAATGMVTLVAYPPPS